MTGGFGGGGLGDRGNDNGYNAAEIQSHLMSAVIEVEKECDKVIIKCIDVSSQLKGEETNATQKFLKDIQDYLTLKKEEVDSFSSVNDLNTRAFFLNKICGWIANEDRSALLEALADNHIREFKGWISQRLYTILTEYRHRLTVGIECDKVINKCIDVSNKFRNEERNATQKKDKKFLKDLQDYLTLKKSEVNFSSLSSVNDLSTRASFINKICDLIDNENRPGLLKILADENIRSFKGWISKRLYTVLTEYRQWITQEVAQACHTHSRMFRAVPLVQPSGIAVTALRSHSEKRPEEVKIRTP